MKAKSKLSALPSSSNACNVSNAGPKRWSICICAPVLSDVGCTQHEQMDYNSEGGPKRSRTGLSKGQLTH